MKILLLTKWTLPFALVAAIQELKYELPLEWAEFMEVAWKAHTRKYKEVPKSISITFSEINDWPKTLFE